MVRAAPSAKRGRIRAEPQSAHSRDAGGTRRRRVNRAAGRLQRLLSNSRTTGSVPGGHRGARLSVGRGHEWEDDAQATTFGCEVQLTTSLEPGTIAEICAKVRGISSRHSGELDGWGTEVCKDTPPGT